MNRHPIPGQRKGTAEDGEKGDDFKRDAQTTMETQPIAIERIREQHTGRKTSA